MALASMTGFARTEGDGFGISWVWELKSVNGRGLDLRLRLAPGWDALEPELRGLLAGRLRRGSIAAALSVARTAPPAPRINRQLLAQLLAIAGELGEAVVAAPRLDGLLALKGVVETVDDEPEAVIAHRREAILAGWAQAVDRLAAARAAEGARLAALLSDQLDEMVRLVAAAGQCAAAQPAAIQARLVAVLAGLGAEVPALPPERLAQEVALAAARADVREELARLSAHLAQAAQFVEENEAVGRRLDFLCQELNREANTLCAKSADIELTRIGLALKAAIEQFREQVQNVE